MLTRLDGSAGFPAKGLTWRCRSVGCSFGRGVVIGARDSQNASTVWTEKPFFSRPPSIAHILYVACWSMSRPPRRAELFLEVSDVPAVAVSMSKRQET